MDVPSLSLGSVSISYIYIYIHTYLQSHKTLQLSMSFFPFWDAKKSLKIPFRRVLLPGLGHCRGTLSTYGLLGSLVGTVGFGWFFRVVFLGWVNPLKSMERLGKMLGTFKNNPQGISPFKGLLEGVQQLGAIPRVPPFLFLFNVSPASNMAEHFGYLAASFRGCIWFADWGVTMRWKITMLHHHLGEDFSSFFQAFKYFQLKHIDET